MKNIYQNDNLAVTFGGSDPYNLTTKIFKILKKIGWGEQTNIYIGKAYSNDQKINLIKKIKKHKNFNILKFNFKNIIKSRVIISSFSSFSYEMAYLKKINFVLLLRKKINIPSNIFFKNTINLGYYSNITSEMLKNSLYKHWKIDNIIENVKIKNNATTEYLKILQS
jgi:spore coat polysaccharide biosynthesis predicted glycosyltransferase SpsG